MIPENLKGFPFPYRKLREGDFVWEISSTLATGMICRGYTGYEFLAGAETRHISGPGLGMLKFHARVSVEFIYLMSLGI